MALGSHCLAGLGAEPSAMSPTLQLSTFIKRLQTPPRTHWQDWGWPADGGHFGILIENGHIEHQPPQQVLKHGRTQMSERKINKDNFNYESKFDAKFQYISAARF
ncbi:hypothetical protein EYF80_038691 [Liparis tanakae]|uniref:Uncharacterized protein n=1 Tax=Liparis tanakae TaxID=230148 RepID=A0A4Z2GEG8_9TELE|nr:hypothetical protein EYF80_038691 [Liparis tanakae]